MFETIMRWWNNLLGKKDIKQLIGIDINISDDMVKEINKWIGMWQGKADWNNEEVPSSQIPSIISNLISVQIGEEIDITSKNKQLNDKMQKLNEKSYFIVEAMANSGGCLVRPLYSDNKLTFETLFQGNFYPTSFDVEGTLTGAVCITNIIKGNKKYTRIETHNFANRTHTITNRAFTSNNGMYQEVPLTSVTEWESIPPEYVINNLDMPLIVYFKPRKINKIDFSHIGVSLFADCADLIQKADEHLGRMDWEQAGGALAIDVDDAHFPMDKNGNTNMDKAQQRLYRISHFSSGEDSYRVFSPALRTDQQNEYWEFINRVIEKVIGSGKGTLSSVDDVQKTATQFEGGQKGFYTLVDMFENEIADKYKQCAYAFASYLNAFERVPFDYEIEVTYNDQDRVNPTQKATLESTLIQNVNAMKMGGSISDVEARQKYIEYGLLPKDADANDVPKQIEVV